MSKRTIDNYTFYWRNLKLHVRPSLASIDPALALPLSVKKWNVIRRVDGPAGVHTNGIETCGLCAIYWSNDCKGCIVKEVTGQPLCIGTPHHYAFRSPITDEQTRGFFEAEYQFLSILQSDGVEAGREWLSEWLETY